jgi:hypothetical protein
MEAKKRKDKHDSNDEKGWTDGLVRVYQEFVRIGLARGAIVDRRLFVILRASDVLRASLEHGVETSVVNELERYGVISLIPVHEGGLVCVELKKVIAPTYANEEPERGRYALH